VFSPNLTLTSGFRVNVVAGQDLNGDQVNNHRPLFRGRNDVEGPGFQEFNLRVSRNFRFYSEMLYLEIIGEAEHRQCPPESISEELILADLLSIACADCSLSIGVSRRGHGNRFAQFCGRRFGIAEIGDRRLRRLDQPHDRRSIRG